MPPTIRWLLAAILLGAALLPAVVAAQGTDATPEAADPSPPATKFGIYPIGDFKNPWFQVEIDAGSTVQLTAGVLNAGTEPVALRSFAANAYNTPNGGFAAATEEEPPTGPTRWVDYSGDSFVLEPGELREQPFTISVPPNTAPGQYVTALVVRTEGEVELPGVSVFDHVIRGAVSIEIMVPGSIALEFSLGDPEVRLDSAMPVLTVPIHNTGNVMVFPEGEVMVTTPDGEQVLTSDVKMGSVYGGGSTEIRIVLPEQLPVDEFLLSADLTDAATGTTASIEAAPVAVVDPEVDAPLFQVDAVGVTPIGEPVRYADVTATITNNGTGIPTASIALVVQRDGEEIERYPLADNQALPEGTTKVAHRYIPADDWEPGTWSFRLVVTSVSDGTETALATIDVADPIIVP